MDIRQKIYFGTSGVLVVLALAILVCWIVSINSATSVASRIAPFLTVPFIFLFPAGIALTWFVEQSMEIHRKLRILVWSLMGLAALLWAYWSIVFFFGPIAP
jgi:hypothetical protein